MQCFNRQNFAKQPVRLILQALEKGKLYMFERAHYFGELPLSVLTSNFVNSKIDHKKHKGVSPEDYQPLKRIIDKSLEKDRVLEIAANALFSCVEESILPPWMFSLFPADLLEKNKTNTKNVEKPRAWVHWNSGLREGAGILAPKIEGGYLKCPMAAIGDGIEGRTQFYSLETGFPVAILDIDTGGERQYRTDAQFKIVKVEAVADV